MTPVSKGGGKETSLVPEAQEVRRGKKIRTRPLRCRHVPAAGDNIFSFLYLTVFFPVRTPNKTLFTHWSSDRLFFTSTKEKMFPVVSSVINS